MDGKRSERFLPEELVARAVRHDRQIAKDFPRCLVDYSPECRGYLERDATHGVSDANWSGYEYKKKVKCQTVR
jgi:hypothetical protein